MRKYTILLIVLTLIMFIPNTTAWSNGGYSADPEHPDYGTHDWIAEHALNWLPAGEKSWLNNTAYLLGTELPDNPNASIGGIGDTANHHVYYYKNYTIQDNASANRAQEEYILALNYLKSGNYRNASIRAGIMTHYIADVACFCHVMGNKTDWGSESNHSNYENYVTGKMKNYTSSVFDHYLAFDGSLDSISANTATLSIGYNATFGDSLHLKNCTWMNKFYNWSNPEYKDSCGASLNLAVNIITDVLHTLAVESKTVNENGILIFVSIAFPVVLFLERRIKI